MPEYDYQVTELHAMMDGDTYELTVVKEVSFGFNFDPVLQWKARFRLYDANSPERGQPLYREATDFSRAWITDAIRKGVLRGTTFKPPANMLPDGQFGRWLIYLYRTDNGEYLASALKTAGLAV